METPQQIEAIGSMLGDGSENAVAAAAAAVHARHARAGTDAITNYLITAYCPAVAHRAGLTRSERQQAVVNFAQRARQIVAGTPNSLRRFAEKLVGDGDPVRAAVTLPWSNGQVEGQINRLKLLKRQMYGRAKLDLLSRRFLLAA